MVQYTQDQVAHLWAEQGEVTEASIRSGNFYFRGPTIYSFRDSWPLATIVPNTSPRVIIMNVEDSGHSGWNCDGKQRGIIGNALRGRDDIQINVDRRQLANYLITSRHDQPQAWTILGQSLIQGKIEALKAKATRLSRPTKGMWESRPIGSDEARDERCDLITDEDIVAVAGQFNLTADYDLEAIRQIVRDGFASFNEPAKVKARASAARRSCVTKTKQMVERFLRRGYARDRNLVLGREASEIVAEAIKVNPGVVLPLIEEVQIRLALREIKKTFNLLHPEAYIVVNRDQSARLYKHITPDQWRDGEKGSVESQWDIDTMVRREGDKVVTSRGAEVPFSAAVKLYQLAAQCRASEMETYPKGLYAKVGDFQLNKIDAEGNCTVGCHYLKFDEMERLAVREVPHLVKPRYPLPMVA